MIKCFLKFRKKKNFDIIKKSKLKDNFEDN